MDPLWPVKPAWIAQLDNERAERTLERATTKRQSPLRPQRGVLGLSQARAKICVMNHDTVTAGLWALAGFDPALVHLAELRERFATLPEDDQIRVTLDRLTSVYVEGQCHELERAAGITTHGFLDLDPTITAVTEHILDCTSDPLGLEI